NFPRPRSHRIEPNRLEAPTRIAPRQRASSRERKDRTEGGAEARVCARAREMGSDGRSWNGVAGGARGDGEEKTRTVAAPAPALAEVPTSTASVDISLPLPEMTPRIIDLCKELVKEWSSLDSSCFSISTVSGGITNMLLKVSVKEGSDSESSVTVRLYGPNTDLVIDRERELQLQGSGLGYLEYLRMEWFRHSSMLGHYHLQT
uniref:ethanolamine kinase n=2 Tax=Aegilops tauschii subsp. strangulata TaxID=200361 RepID=A0A453KUN4_AEGTS